MLKLRDKVDRVTRASGSGLLAYLLIIIALASTCLAQQKPSTPQRLPTAEKVVENYLKAIGGRKRATSIQDATYDWTIKSQDQTQGTAKIQIKAPAAVRAEINFANQEIISAANSRSAWGRGRDGQLRTLTGAEAAAAKLQAALDAAHLVDYKRSNVLARVASVSEAPGGTAYVVEFSARGGGHLKYLFSVATKLLVGIQDEVRKTSTWFDDYRSEGSILEPHSLRISSDGTGELRWSLTRATYNSGLAAAVFDPPRSAEAEDVAALLREVSKNQDEVEKRFNEYSFLQKETDREIDSKGVVKKETVKVSEIFPIPNRAPIEKLISENGVPLSPERAAKEDKRVQEEFEKAEHDKDRDAQKAAERRAKREREKAKSNQDEDGDPEISEFFKNCEFVSPRRERFQDRETIVFDFRVKPGFKPSTREENLISKLVGVVWIDPLDKQVIRLEARLAEGFKMAGGLLVSLRPGAALVMEQTRMNEGVWMPRLAQLNLSVKVLVFGGGDINKTVEWTDYKHFSAGVEGYKIESPPNGETLKKKP
jgi:hypothetical protein